MGTEEGETKEEDEEKEEEEKADGGTLLATLLVWKEWGKTCSFFNNISIDKSRDLSK